MLDNLEELELQLAKLQGQLDGHGAYRQLERDRLLKEFPKRDMLKEEAKRVNGGWMPYDHRYNFSCKEDIVSWIVKETISDPSEVVALYNETKERIYAVKVGLTHPQWSVIKNLNYAGYDINNFWKDSSTSRDVYTDGGLHFFSVIFAKDVIYLEGKTPAAKDSVVYLAILPDGTTYLVDAIRCEEVRYNIARIKYGELEQI